MKVFLGHKPRTMCKQHKLFLLKKLGERAFITYNVGSNQVAREIFWAKGGNGGGR